MFRSTKRLGNPVKNMQQLASWLVFHLTRVKTEWKHAAKKRARDLDSKTAAWNKFGGKMASRNRAGSPYNG